MPLNTDNLPNNHRLIYRNQNLGFANQELFVVISDTLLYLITKAPSLSPDQEDEPGLDVYQTEYPIKSIPWFIDTVENKIWRSSKDGGLPSGQYSITNTIDGEQLKISRDMNCGEKYQKGISWKNLSRVPDYSAFGYQEKQLTDEMLLEGGLLNLFKDIAK
ncbi:hypothetical protein OQJ59_16455 [Microbulbifer thermotolerans]|uniref:hypothetical protein n=1 Tax=Microbulbifer thermotolerans TaxID=252514 RepID=UPI00224B34D0|nr:hypothetical protein [Microbulbifer thermotolerans]MCX2843203.1 hypothetical protein [Microbulbifer thermotolerans]